MSHVYNGVARLATRDRSASTAADLPGPPWAKEGHEGYRKIGNGEQDVVIYYLAQV